MAVQEQIYQVGVEMVAEPARGENFISIGPDLTGKFFEINPPFLDMLKKKTFLGACWYSRIYNLWVQSFGDSNT